MNAYIQATLALFNGFDWLLITMTGISTLYGLFRGFIKEALTITAWAFAAWLSYFYAEPLSVYLEPQIETASMRVALMVLGLFMVVLSTSSLLRTGLNYLVNKVGLLGLDYVLGAIFGVLRGIAFSMILMVLLLNLGFSEDVWWQKSYMVKTLSGVIESLGDHVPESSKDVFERYTSLSDRDSA